MKLSVDKVYRKVERTVENKYFVKGVSVINHKVRIELGLSLREYVLLDFIYTWMESKRTSITYGDLWIGTAIHPRFIDRMFQRLKAKDLLFKDKDGRVKTTHAWNSCFNVDESFMILWNMHKIGVKEKARAAYKKSVKIDTAENIKKGLEKYLEYLKVTEQFPTHLSTFLNYKTKMWQTEFDASVYKKSSNNNQLVTKAETGPTSVFD